MYDGSDDGLLVGGTLGDTTDIDMYQLVVVDMISTHTRMTSW